jgi:hypothetical protein
MPVLSKALMDIAVCCAATPAYRQQCTTAAFTATVPLQVEGVYL